MDNEYWDLEDTEDDGTIWGLPAPRDPSTSPKSTVALVLIEQAELVALREIVEPKAQVSEAIRLLQNAATYLFGFYRGLDVECEDTAYLSEEFPKRVEQILSGLNTRHPEFPLRLETAFNGLVKELNEIYKKKGWGMRHHSNAAIQDHKDGDRLPLPDVIEPVKLRQQAPSLVPSSTSSLEATARPPAEEPAAGAPLNPFDDEPPAVPGLVEPPFKGPVNPPAFEMPTSEIPELGLPSTELPPLNGLRFLTASTIAVLLAMGVHEHKDYLAQAEAANQLTALSAGTLPESTATEAAAKVEAPKTEAPTMMAGPVYFEVRAAFEGDTSGLKERKIAETTNRLVQNVYAVDGAPDTWEEVRALHPWNELALPELDDKLWTWGGYKDVRIAGKKCDPQTISDFVGCVARSSLPHAGLVALNLSEQITAIEDTRIMPEGGAQMNADMAREVSRFVAETNARYEPVEPEVPTSAAAPASEADGFGTLYEAPDPGMILREQADLPDVSGFLEVVPPHSGLEQLASRMENMQGDLMKKARGENRRLLPQFCAGLAEDLRGEAARFESLSPSGRELALFQLRTKFLTGLNVLHGRPKANYLKMGFIEFTEQLAALSPSEESRRSLLDVPKGIFKA